MILGLVDTVSESPRISYRARRSTADPRSGTGVIAKTIVVCTTITGPRFGIEVACPAANWQREYVPRGLCPGSAMALALARLARLEERRPTKCAWEQKVTTRPSAGSSVPPRTGAGPILPVSAMASVNEHRTMIRTH